MTNGQFEVQQVMIRGAELHNYIPGVGIGAVGCFLCGDAPVSLSQLIQV